MPDLVEKIAVEIPNNMRLVVKKRQCPICPEAQRAIDIFNANTTNKKIRIIDSNSFTFQRHYRLFQHVLDSKSIPTPTIIFDGHVITYEEGGCEWYELFCLINELDRLSEVKL